MVLVRCHNKSYNVSVAPMADVETVMTNVARLALSEGDLAAFDVTSARLFVPDKGKADTGKELERGVPWRFLNVASGASLTLLTGLERVLGVDGAAQPTPGPASVAAKPEASSPSAQPKNHKSPPTATVAATAAGTADQRAEQAVSSRQAGSLTPNVSAVAEAMTPEDMYLFHARDVEVSAAWNDDDIDYEVTQGDALLMQSSLVKKTKTLTSGTLQTKQMRDEARRRKLESLPKARIRVETGPILDDLVVQFDLPAVATLEDLHSIVQHKVLKSPTTRFRLIDCMPPRRDIPRNAESVYERGMWPAARLILDLDAGQGASLSMEGTFSESLVRRNGVCPPQKSSPSQEPGKHASTSDAKPPAPVNAGPPAAGQIKAKQGIPKWFKK